MSKYNKPYLADLEPFIQAGIDTKTGLPVKMAGCAGKLKSDITNMLTVVDLQDAISRYKWSNLPEGLDGNLIERMLYYKYQIAVFKMSDDKYYALPFALAGEIDCYGRWRSVTPLPFAGGTSDDDSPWIKGLIKKPVYSQADIDDLPDVDDDACVIIKDYSNGISQTSFARSILDKGLIEVEAECVPFLRTSLINSTGVSGVRVSSEDESANVNDANKALENAALTGQTFVPIVGSLDFQSLRDGSTTKAEEFLRAMQSLDNLRLQMLGLNNGGLFEKNSHMLQTEADTNSGSDAVALSDGLEARKAACELINSAFGLSIAVEVNKEAQPEAVTAEEDTEEEVEDNDSVLL